MKARLLAIATQRRAIMERMENVASTRPAAAKPIASTNAGSLIPCSLSLHRTLQSASGLFTFSGRVGPSWLESRALRAVALGLARQLSRIGAAWDFVLVPIRRT